ncbi:NAD(P)/FAD-dependent oxidoreductase [Pelotomaculum terephthalicicum JT]|uniref:geranylgeranyl reductase family protein n=1 Tax=Pelotomaculum TaxID=191373 RepID=UPI0009C836D3|nr:MULTISPECIES: NAD(P)/FAD-dependent oxidoreductase [Pelotomaculum]MCG9969060.1 NAD(P)/FAD-dependent oxidoreductase [Pelotomaculum terephthalicicum JT]OPX87367.1 MAG: putative oxidoreductase [Pelotomaculum sp. PtaB.Bin117]OPY62862.1 MAG: putative oxidoreductase [Pelotomaculum sp. PtaU1.Bin065]
MKHDVVVIGGGPAGCETARLIAEKGYRVLVAEEHRQIGEPLQCSGLVSLRTLQATAMPDDLIINQIHGAFVHSPGGETLFFREQKVYALVIDRAEFDRTLSERAQRAGVEILTGVRAGIGEFFTDGVSVKLKFRGGESTVRTCLVIGADGANSRVARRISAPKAEDMIRMCAAEVELQCREKDMVHIFLGGDIAPGWFGWVIPVDEKHARVGIGVSGRDKHPRTFFNKMVKAHPGIFQGMKIIRGTSGVVPVGSLARIYGRRTLLVGDAACQTKPISGGGLYLGLLGAELCAKVAAKALAKGNLSPHFLREYQRLWEKEMADEIQTALRHRNIFLTMSDRDMDKLIRFLSRPLWQGIISRYGDIDYPSRLADKLSFAGPWAEKFIMAGFKKILYYCSATRA